MENKLIKRAIISLGVAVVGLSLGTFVGSPTSAFADDVGTTAASDEESPFAVTTLFFKPTSGEPKKIIDELTQLGTDESGKVSMNDFLATKFTSEFNKGYSVYDELAIFFQYANKSSERAQGIADLEKIVYRKEGVSDEEVTKEVAQVFDMGITMINNYHFQDMTIDLAKTTTEVNENKVVISDLDSSDPNYEYAKFKTQDFYVYLKPKVTSSPVVDQSSLTADSQASITVGQTVDADTFNAKATNSAGDSIPVTVDTSKADLKKPGTYSVILTAVNGETKTVTLTVQAAPSPVVPQKKAVYALKKIYLYQKPTFNQHQRLATYVKTNRTNRPMFVVEGYARSKSGLLRYQVKDTAGKTGYITAKSAFIAPVYYQKSVKQIKVLNKKGINSYQDLKLTEAGKHVKMGKTLKVIGLKHYHLTTRFELSNGQYVSANKKLVIAVK